VQTGSAQLCHFFNIIPTVFNTHLPALHQCPHSLWIKNYFRCMHSHSCISSLDQKVTPPTVSLSHRQQGQSELSTHYHSFMPQWNSLDLIPLLTTKQMIESCSSFMIASNRAAIFAHSADIMKLMLPYLLHKVHASNSHWCLTVPTAAHSRVSICFHTWLTLVQGLCKCKLLDFHLTNCRTSHNMPPAFHNDMRMKLSLSHKSPPLN